MVVEEDRYVVLLGTEKLLRLLLPPREYPPPPERPPARPPLRPAKRIISGDVVQLSSVMMAEAVGTHNDDVVVAAIVAAKKTLAMVLTIPFP